MRLYRQKNECSVDEIMERCGFVHSNPDVLLSTARIWTKDGNKYKFTGWEHTPKTALMTHDPKYINIEQNND